MNQENFTELSMTEVIDDDCPEEANGADINHAPGKRNDEEVEDLNEKFTFFFKFITRRLECVRVKMTELPVFSGALISAPKQRPREKKEK